ncbi:hypothetical protein FACS189461_4140 [Spirochaetia bacterium]|nr:hypothetical protein FACS189461_4140 [Spirochaetia bacterium]
MCGSVAEYSIDQFGGADDLLASGVVYHLYFLNEGLREAYETKILHHLEKHKDPGGKNPVYFLTYADDPVSDKDCDTILECISRYLDYDAMYLCVEFLTEQGLKAIAVSKILFFEYCDRKIIIKTQQSRYVCHDTLRNVFSLVSGCAFASPHKSFIVNMRHIADIKGSTVMINDGSLVPLSKKKSHQFRLRYKAYLDDNAARITKKKPNRLR